MTVAWQSALMIGPLASYLVLHGLWQGGSRPKVIPGQLDFSLLALGLATLVGFGPIGQKLVGMCPNSAALPARLTLLASLWLLVLLAAPAAYRRVLVYGVDADDLDDALAETLHEEIPGHFSRTLRGFEDPRAGCGLLVTTHPRSASAEVDAFGKGAEPLATALAAALRHRLHGCRRPAKGSGSWAWYVAALALALAPQIGSLAARSTTGEALRGWLLRLVGSS